MLVFLECKSKFKSSELDPQLSLGGKLTLIEKFIYFGFGVIVVSV